MKKSIIYTLVVAFGLTTFSSCSQDGQTEQPEAESIKPASSMSELTRQLKAYDAQFIRTEEMPSRLPGGVTFSRLDYAKLAITDACGAIRGAGGGFIGIVGGAVGSSLWKGCKMYAMKYVRAQIVNHIKKSPIATYNGEVSYEDSVGYYHNNIQYSLYVQNPESHLLAMENIVRQSNDRMMQMSENYRKSGGLTDSEISSLSSDLEAIETVDASLSYKNYFARLKELYPSDADIIDFCAEYVYTMLYANVDADDYTKEVLYMIKKSNVDLSDSNAAYRAIQIAFASIQYSQNMTYTKAQ